MSEADLQQRAVDFAMEVQALLDAVLPGERQVRAVQLGDKYVVRPEGSGLEPEFIPLLVQGEALASLRLSFRCRLDHFGAYLAVEKSAFVLASTVDRTPLLRYEFVRNSARAPAAHWQVHAERGTFSALLARAGAKAPHDLASLHLPVGGSRLRAGLEDFLEFLVRECGFDARRAWETAVTDSRQAWRERQLAALVRDAPQVAADALRGAGYRVHEPEEGVPSGNPDVLRHW
jgi:hypothetical protein